MAAVVAAPDAPQRGDRKSCELVSSRCILFAFVVLSIFLELIFPSGPLCLLVVAVEVRPPCSGQGASPGGGDIQSEQGYSEEVVRRVQGTAQGTSDRQVRSK
jgi:hypothetical protein